MPDATGPLSLPPTKPCPSPSVQYTTAGDLCLAPQAANAPPPATRFFRPCTNSSRNISPPRTPAIMSHHA